MASWARFARLRRREPLLINFSRSPSRNYAQVQDEIASAVLRHLPADAVTSSERQRREGALNLSLFIGDDQADVLLSHGLADKRYFWRRDPQTRERMLNRFQHVLVPGRLLRDRLLATEDLDLEARQVHVVGWPRLDLLVEQQRAFDAADVPFDQRRPRVLWAPTHDRRKRGPHDLPVSTYPAFEQHLPAIRERAEVEVSLHPRNREDKRPTHQQLLWADYVISDFGTMVYEAWALGKPVLFPYWIVGDLIVETQRNTTEADIFRDRVGYHVDSIEELLGVLDDGPRIGPDVVDFLASYLEPRYFGSSGRRAAQVLDDLRHGRRPG